MRIKTEAFVLRTFRIKDVDLVVNLYTQELGRVDAVANGFFSNHRRKNHALYHPLSYISLEATIKENRELHTINESSPLVIYHYLSTEPIKILYATLIAEIIFKAVQDVVPNTDLFVFIKETVLDLEKTQAGMYNLLIHFIIQLTNHLGFFPLIEVEERQNAVEFNLQEGKIRNAVNGKGEYWEKLVYRFAITNTDDFRAIPVPRQFRRILLHQLFRYYSYHLRDFSNLQSLAVFEEVFQG